MHVGRFSRTICDCEACQQCCHEQPGHILPGQMEQIAEHLQQPLPIVKQMFWASPGAVVMDTQTNRQFRIGTITPKFDRRKKACVFLSDEGKCTIHSVAPFGCSYFDTHMKADEAHRRSAWGLSVIVADEDYKTLRQSLPFAESYKPRRA